MHWAEIEGHFLAAKGLNTNFLQFLLPNHVIISNLYVCFFTCRFLRCMDVHIKQFCMHKSCVRKIVIYKACLSPVNILTIKSKTVSFPPGEVFKPDIYTRKHW